MVFTIGDINFMRSGDVVLCRLKTVELRVRRYATELGVRYSAVVSGVDDDWEPIGTFCSCIGAMRAAFAEMASDPINGKIARDTLPLINQCTFYQQPMVIIRAHLLRRSTDTIMREHKERHRMLTSDETSVLITVFWDAMEFMGRVLEARDQYLDSGDPYGVAMWEDAGEFPLTIIAVTVA